eukprot:2390226-Prymnesium_polylepis.1
MLGRCTPASCRRSCTPERRPHPLAPPRRLLPLSRASRVLSVSVAARAMSVGIRVDHAKECLAKADAVCFDVDSTVIKEEGIDEFAAYLGVGEEVRSVISLLRARARGRCGAQGSQVPSHSRASPRAAGCRAHCGRDGWRHALPRCAGEPPE